MNGVDGLIQWMTHRGQGRWESFKDLVGDIYAHEEQPPKPRWVANTLSMTGVGEFFVSGSNRWRVFAPLIAGISLGQAVVVGGRTATLKEQLRAAATAEGIDLFEEPLRWNVTRIRLYALTDGDLQRVAERTGIPFVPQAADRMIRQAPTLEDRVAQGQRVQAPRNWCVESYDFSTFNWVGRDIAHSAKAFTPSRGVPRYTFEKADGSLVQMERRESVYAAAFSQSIALLAYDPEIGEGVHSVQGSAPLHLREGRRLLGPDGAPRIRLCGRLQPVHRPARIRPRDRRRRSLRPGECPVTPSRRQTAPWSRWSAANPSMRPPSASPSPCSHTTPRSAKAFTPSRGVPRYTFEKADGSLVQMERRESVYAAAFSQSIALLAYDPDSSIVSVPSSAPLPADMERAVALCTGDLPSRENGRSVFAGVRWSVGSVLLALTGCPLPVIPYRPQGVRQ